MGFMGVSPSSGLFPLFTSVIGLPGGLVTMPDVLPANNQETSSLENYQHHKGADMPKHIQDKNGKFAGSIGDGKNQVPTAAPVISVQPIVLDAQGRREVSGILGEMSRIAAESAANWQNTLDELNRIEARYQAQKAITDLTYAHLPIEEAIRAEGNRGTKFAILYPSYYEQHPEPQDVAVLEAQLADVRARQAAAGLLPDEN
jgi:hypothetical protein